MHAPRGSTTITRARLPPPSDPPRARGPSVVPRPVAPQDISRRWSTPSDDDRLKHCGHTHFPPRPVRSWFYRPAPAAPRGTVMLSCGISTDRRIFLPDPQLQVSRRAVHHLHLMPPRGATAQSSSAPTQSRHTDALRRGRQVLQICFIIPLELRTIAIFLLGVIPTMRMQPRVLSCDKLATARAVRANRKPRPAARTPWDAPIPRRATVFGETDVRHRHSFSAAAGRFELRVHHVHLPTTARRPSLLTTAVDDGNPYRAGLHLQRAVVPVLTAPLVARRGGGTKLRRAYAPLRIATTPLSQQQSICTKSSHSHESVGQMMNVCLNDPGRMNPPRASIVYSDDRLRTDPE